MQCNYQLTKQNWLFCVLGTVLPTGFDFKICFWARNVTRPFEKGAPGRILNITIQAKDFYGAITT